MNIPEILSEHNIAFATEGQSKNSRHGWIQIQICPFCGDAKGHMGIPITGNACSCYKCGSHKISEFLYLMDISAKEWFLSDPFVDNETTTESDPEPWPDPVGPLTTNARKYLMQRGFSPSYLNTKFQFQSTLLGSRHPHRIIVPTGRGWVARAIDEDANKRYINSKGYNLKESLFSIENVIGDFIVVCEGIFDAIKAGTNAVCTYGVSLSEKQKLIMSRYKKVFIAFDKDEAGMKASDSLWKFLGLMTEAIKVPYEFYENKKDIGDFDKDQVKKFRTWIEANS